MRLLIQRLLCGQETSLGVLKVMTGIVYSEHVLNVQELHLGFLSFTPVSGGIRASVDLLEERGSHQERKCVRVGVVDVCVCGSVCMCGEGGLLSDSWGWQTDEWSRNVLLHKQRVASLPCKALVGCRSTAREYGLRQEGWNLYAKK